LLAIFSKPIVDIFWAAKSQGLISPLFIVGVSVPALAIYRRKYLIKKTLANPYDNLILAYILIIGFITIIKIILVPQYLFNSINFFARILSVTSFYFIGKYYFVNDYKIKQLAYVTIASTIIPFFLTLAQQMFGKVAHFSDVAGTGAKSAFYLHGRHGLVRISGIYEGVYELAFLGLCASLIIFSIQISKERLYNWCYIMLPIAIYFLYFTYSRSAWCLFIFSIFLFCLIKQRFKLLVAMIFCAVIIYALVPNVQYRFEDELSFVLGNSDFQRIGYGRGGLWLRVLNQFGKQDIIYQLVGNYNLGNAENQFLGTLIWFGYLGLLSFLLLNSILTIKLYSKLKLSAQYDDPVSNVKSMFACIVIGGYWIAGLGNQFNIMISTQWILWTWTGIIINNNQHEAIALTHGQEKNWTIA